MFLFIKNLWLRLFPSSTPEPAAPKRKSGTSDHDHGTWYYLHDILDRLDKYELFLRRFKKAHPDAYDLYSRVGAQVVGKRAVASARGDTATLPPRWRNPNERRPAFGMYYDPRGDKNETVAGDKDPYTMPSFFWFQKMSFVPDTAPHKGDLYKCGVYWDWFGSSPAFKNDPGRYALEYCVDVLPNGDIKVLKYKKHSGGSIPSHSWETPELPQCAESEWTAQQAAEFDFSTCAAMIENASDGFRISALRNGIVAAFNINLLRTPYFFQHRDKTVTVSGRTKPIFHIVRTHKRVTKSGKETFVKSHFRGVREFLWHGWDVVITMPGLHHISLLEFDAAAKETRNPDNEQGFVGMDEMGRRIRSTISGRKRVQAGADPRRLVKAARKQRVQQEARP